jgi:hypothetical protein
VPYLLFEFVISTSVYESFCNFARHGLFELFRNLKFSLAIIITLSSQSYLQYCSACSKRLAVQPV